MRAVIYVRAAQGDDLIAAQLNHCKTVASQRRFEVVGEYSDVGCAGSKDNMGIQAMLADAAAGKFDVVVTVNLSRFSRQLTEKIKICEELQSHGVTVLTETGDVADLWVAARDFAKDHFFKE